MHFAAFCIVLYKENVVSSILESKLKGIQLRFYRVEQKGKQKILKAKLEGLNSLPANTDFSSLAAFRRTVYSIDLEKFLHYSNDRTV